MRFPDLSRWQPPNRDQQLGPGLWFLDELWRADGVVAVSEPSAALSIPTLKDAYLKGIFPWPLSRTSPIPWCSPPKRAILPFDRFHISRSLRRSLNKARWSFSVDRAFDSVILACARVPRAGQRGTWITPLLAAAYMKLHRSRTRVKAHSVEVWNGERLVGGVYGVDAGGVFCAESMFHVETDASKAALVHLIGHLGARGASWMDIQVMTPHLQKMGAVEITRSEFLDRLAEARARATRLF